MVEGKDDTPEDSSHCLKELSSCEERAIPDVALGLEAGLGGLIEV